MKLRRYQLEWLARIEQEILREKSRQIGSSLELAYEMIFRGCGVWFISATVLCGHVPDDDNPVTVTAETAGRKCPKWAIGREWKPVARFTGDPLRDTSLTPEQIEYIRQCAIDDGHPEMFWDRRKPEVFYYCFNPEWAQTQAIMHIRAPEAEAWVNTYLIPLAMPAVMPLVEKMWGRTASEVKPRKGIDATTGERIYLPSGKAIRTYATNATTAQGASADVYWDEAALPSYSQQSAIFDTLSKMTTLGQRFVLSSRHAGRSVFRERIKQCRDGDLPNAAVVTVNLYDAILQGAVDMHGEPLDPKKLRASCKSKEDYEEQYLCLPRNAGEAVLPAELCDRLEAAAYPAVAHIDDANMPVADPSDPLAWVTAVWERPLPGVSYVLSADIALGRDGESVKANRTCLMVWRVDEGRLVARCAGFTPLGRDVARRLRSLGAYYNWAFIAPERNGPGEAVLERLCDPEDERCFYPQHLIYSFLAYGSKQLSRIGWPTNRKTRSVMLDAFCQWITETVAGYDADSETYLVSPELYPDAFALAELRDLQYDKNGEKEGDPYDDTVCAAAIALSVMNEHRDWLLSRTDLGSSTRVSGIDPSMFVVELTPVEERP